MRRSTILFAMFCVFVAVVWFGFDRVVAAHSIDRSKTGDLSMKQQHKTMETLQSKWTKAKAAVGRGDSEAAARDVAVMERLSSNIARFQPHRNGSRHDELVGHYKKFLVDLSQLRGVAASHNTVVAKDLVKAVDEDCLQCHAVFR